ncbi:MAG: hypothetical protein ACFCBW_15350 [Candidatus Competibacterales bacterium]
MPLRRICSKPVALTLKAEAIHLQRSLHGLTFLGHRIFPRFIRVHPENWRRSRRRERRQVRRWQRGALSDEQLSHVLASLYGHRH